MSVWEQIPGQAAPTALLRRDVASGRVAHAYLFAGAGGAGPREVALAFGAALHCVQGGCGVCESCTRVLHHAHPDVEVIEPAGMQLLVDQVRDAVRSAWRKPVAGPRRVIIVEGADRMNPNAQNAFLKALEEPPASTTIVLIAPSPETLLETVRSRCREVAFRTLPEAEVAAMLERDGVAAADARRWARVGGGVDRAWRLARDTDLQTLRRELVDRVLQPGRDPGDALEHAAWLAEQTKAVRERLADEMRERAEEHADWVQETKRAAEDRLRREQRRAEQDALEAALDDVMSVVRDLLVARDDPEAPLLNEEYRAAVVARAEGLASAAQITICVEEVERARRRLRANANVLLALEAVFLGIHRRLG